MKKRIFACALSGLIGMGLLASNALAQSKSGDLNAGPRPERGWFFFENPPKKQEPKPKEEQPAPTVAPMPTTPPPEPKEDRCKKKDTWSADCGFVNPGSDFAFQAKQRDALLEKMAVSNNDPKAVEAFQYYMRWALERTSEVTNLWWYNMTQNPDLDPTVSQPVSAFGLRLMTGLREGKAKEIYELLKSEGAFYIYFSRSDCNFCHQMEESMKFLSERTGLEVRNASLDDKCMPSMTQGCLTAPRTLAAAQALQVTTVPSVFLFVPKNTWLRIGTGTVDVESMATRTVQFFSAYRNALLKGVENGQNGRPSVDFSDNAPTGTAEGVAKGQGQMRVPTEAEVEKLLGK